MLRLHLSGRRLVWDDADVFAMARALGPEIAAQCSTTMHPSVVRLAQKYHVPVATRADHFLARYDARTAQARDFWRTPRESGDLQLWTTQRTALNFIRTMQLQRILLADRVGLGKTPIATRWLSSLELTPEQRVLVICRNSAKYQWARELHRWWKGPRLWTTVVEGTKSDQAASARRANGIVIAHWESLALLGDDYDARPWDAVVADEIHNAANRQTHRAKHLFALDATHRMAITAHPYANGPDELWAILHWLHPERYRSFWTYFHMHVKADPKPFGGFEVTGLKRPKLLQWELAPFLIRRIDRTGLPAITRRERLTSLTPKMQKEYDALRKEFFVELKAHRGQTKVLAIPSVLARITRLRQYVIDPGLIGAQAASVKYPVIAELLEDAGEPYVIFTSFEQAAMRLAQYLKRRHFRTGVFSGRVAPRQRDQVQRRFLAGRYDAVLIVTQAGGESLNFGKYGLVAFLDLPWHSRAVEQAEGRVDRPEEGTGALVPTTSTRVLVRDTYDMRIVEKIERKHRNFAEAFTVSDLGELFG